MKSLPWIKLLLTVVEKNLRYKIFLPSCSYINIVFVTIRVKANGIILNVCNIIICDLWSNFPYKYLSLLY